MNRSSPAGPRSLRERAGALRNLPDAQGLILDQPTAALDARAEFQVLERFEPAAVYR